MRKTFQYKLYQAKRNKHLHQQIDIAAGIYNHCIALHKRYYRLYGKSLNKYQLQKHITGLKKQEKFKAWNQVGSQAIQDITDRIDRAYKLFFDSLKSERKVAPPGFRKRVKYKSFTLKQAGYKLLGGNKVKIGKRIYRFHHSRNLEGMVKTLTVKRDPLGDLYLFFSCDIKDQTIDRIMTGKSAGFDFGLKTFLMPSNETDPIQSPLFFKQGIKAVKKANNVLSRKKKGSNHRKQARKHLARVHRTIANKRKDFHFKTAKALVSEYDLLCFEDLNIKAMQLLWGRKVSDLGLFSFLRTVEHYCRQEGSELVFVDRFFPSSKMCSSCGHINKELALKDRSWVCSECRTDHDRDKNAAMNIHREGASSLGLGDVRPALQAVPA
ncbi:RNA-guided endonuclease InsQ/TnpB family protein [Desulfotignum phosphitoxidans]|jgi:putative transposase|uniref:Putative transposase in snaA-snaB intergenic region n=1 Tax=Desulfotignum phosphitoxidans DSM 13687 TaxID=1286635 RepID=S0G174_9BACT|nr:RNA-guided endonuclease TnpB family protein [Desulfotignum phosphitoxidans]EMS80665.1 putative transposase in snaA-snaB intergenic region [Desulfotignum phosphitoxidans DSM 13687]